MDKKETLNIKKIYHEKIEKLYLEYSDNKNNEILGRGLIIVNELFKNPDLLILGNNPSLNPEHNESVEKQNQIAYWYPYIIIGEKEEDFNLNKLNKNDDKYIKVLDNQDNINKDKIIKCHHPETILFNSYIYCNYYYKFVKKIEEKLNNKICWEYFDLYWVRTINSKELENNRNKDNNLRNFLDEQAKLTIEIIKKIQPKIIIGAFKSLESLKDNINNNQNFFNIIPNKNIDNLKKSKINVLSEYTFLPDPIRKNYNIIKEYIHIASDAIIKYKN